MRKAGNRLSFANVTSVIALFVALGGTAFAAATIGADDIKRNAVRSKHIKQSNVKRGDLAPNAVNGGKIANGAVRTPDIGDGTVTAAKLNAPAQWVNVPLNAGWTTFAGDTQAGFTFGPVQCYKDPFGIVHLRGAAETDQPNPPSVGALPPACRVIQETSTPESNPYAEFAIVRLTSGGFSEGAIAGYVGFDAVVPSQNALAEDDPGAYTAGEGVSFDGVALGAR